MIKIHIPKYCLWNFRPTDLYPSALIIFALVALLKSKRNPNAPEYAGLLRIKVVTCMIITIVIFSS